MIITQIYGGEPCVFTVNHPRTLANFPCVSAYLSRNVCELLRTFAYLVANFRVFVANFCEPSAYSYKIYPEIYPDISRGYFRVSVANFCELLRTVAYLLVDFRVSGRELSRIRCELLQTCREPLRISRVSA
jgi:hypothetical protein